MARVVGFEPTCNLLTYTGRYVLGVVCLTAWLYSHIRGIFVISPRLPNIHYLLVITAITDTVTPGSWRGFVQDFLKPRRLF